MIRRDEMGFMVCVSGCAPPLSQWDDESCEMLKDGDSDSDSDSDRGGG